MPVRAHVATLAAVLFLAVVPAFAAATSAVGRDDGGALRVVAEASAPVEGRDTTGWD
ncbi:hypothetical protein ACGFY8_09135 [Streptomyces sp. NPDC048232]|uniref:hypothetical protein n=1 Tax=Streptomyces sp. NPDC048232 TaxID=3365520 RepID=UPI003721DEFD